MAEDVPINFPMTPPLLRKVRVDDGLLPIEVGGIRLSLLMDASQSMPELVKDDTRELALRRLVSEPPEIHCRLVVLSQKGVRPDLRP